MSMVWKSYRQVRMVSPKTTSTAFLSRLHDALRQRGRSKLVSKHRPSSPKDSTRCEKGADCRSASEQSSSKADLSYPRSSLALSKENLRVP